MVSEVASKLAMELAILHANVQSNPFFRPPSEVGKEILPHLPEILEVNSLHHQSQLLPIQRVSRAASLPPNPELIHSRPEQNDERNDKRPLVELPRIKTEIRPESFSLERRSLGDGVPQYQPYWYFLPLFG